MRKIKVYTGSEKLAVLCRNVLHTLSVQLSDGNWENYEDFYEEFWNWLDFGVQLSDDNTKNCLIIKVKSKPTWKGTKDIFSDKKDDWVISYISKALEECFNEAPQCFYKFVGGVYVEDEIKQVLDILNDAQTWYNSEEETLKIKEVKVSLTQTDLFNIEMAIDEVLWRLSDANSEQYKAFEDLEHRIRAERQKMQVYAGKKKG